MARIVFLALALGTLCLGAAGCVSIEGGAVEASWDLQSHDGRGIADCDCTCPQIAKVRFRVVAADGNDLCAGRADCEFACRRKHGATPFDIPPGSYALSLVPVGAAGLDLTGGPIDGCSARSSVAPTLREVKHGQPTQLDAIAISADCAPACGGSDSTKVCTKP
jgi:hypothetical protein